MTIARVLRWPTFVLPLEPVTPLALPCLPRVPGLRLGESVEESFAQIGVLLQTASARR